MRSRNGDNKMKILPTRLIVRVLESILIVFLTKGVGLFRYLMGDEIKINFNFYDILLAIIFFAVLYSNDLREDRKKGKNEITN